jgi:hypothetical protein
LIESLGSGLVLAIAAVAKSSQNEFEIQSEDNILIRALASLVKMQEPGNSQHDFHIPLCDLLLDLAEQDVDGRDAFKLVQIAHSFGHDFLNLATLAGRLLWCEGVTPNMSRSPDLVAIGVDTENYLVLLRAACDTLTGAIVHFGVEPGDRGKIPSDSFNGLKKWIEKDRTRINRFYERFRFIADPFDWFYELKDIRDDLVHRGYHCNIHTDRVLLRLILMPIGTVELQMLHGGYKQEEYREDKPRFRQAPLLSLLKRFTLSILALASQLAQAIEEQHAVRGSRTHVLNGVYVPALHQLTSYEEPTERHLLSPTEERGLRIEAWHLLNAGDYLSASERGYPGGFWWRFLLRISELFANQPRYVSEPRFAHCGSLVEWHFVFREGKSDFALSIRDMVSLEADWLKNAKDNLDDLAKKAGASRAVLVANRFVGAQKADAGWDTSEFLIIERDPISAAESAFRALVPTQQ